MFLSPLFIVKRTKNRERQCPILINAIHYKICTKACSLVVTNLRSETKGFRFETGC